MQNLSSAFSLKGETGQPGFPGSIGPKGQKGESVSMKAFKTKEKYLKKKIELKVFFHISSNSMSLVCQPLPWQTTTDQIFEQVLYARHEVT